MKGWLIGLVLVVLGAAGWYYFKMYQPQAEQEVVPSTPPMIIEAPEPEPMVIADESTDWDDDIEIEAEPGLLVEEEPLPVLEQSDPVATHALNSLVGESMTTRYFAVEDVISRMVATVDALGSRQVPGAIQAVKGPESDFEVTADEQPGSVILNEEGDPIPQFLVDPVNYRRYLVYVEMLETIDVDQFASLYHQNYALFQQAFLQLGYSNQEFDGRLIAVIDELLATPEVQDPVRLIKPEAYYKFADEDLEALPAGQKALIRLGSENAARVKLKLTEIRAALTRTATG